MCATLRLQFEMKNTPDRDVRFETLEKLALLGEVVHELVEFEKKLINDLDVD